MRRSYDCVLRESEADVGRSLIQVKERGTERDELTRETVRVTVLVTVTVTGHGIFILATHPEGI